MNESDDVVEVVDSRGQRSKKRLLVDRSAAVKVRAEILAGQAIQEDAGDTTVADTAAVITEQIRVRRRERKPLQLLDFVRKPHSDLIIPGSGVWEELVHPRSFKIEIRRRFFVPVVGDGHARASVVPGKRERGEDALGRHLGECLIDLLKAML